MSAVGDARKRLADAIADTAPGSDFPIVTPADLQGAYRMGWEAHRNGHPHDPTFAVVPTAAALLEALAVERAADQAKRLATQLQQLGKEPA